MKQPADGDDVSTGEEQRWSIAEGWRVRQGSITAGLIVPQMLAWRLMRCPMPAPRIISCTKNAMVTTALSPA